MSTAFWNIKRCHPENDGFAVAIEYAMHEVAAFLHARRVEYGGMDNDEALDLQADAVEHASAAMCKHLDIAPFWDPAMDREE